MNIEYIKSRIVKKYFTPKFLNELSKPSGIPLGHIIGKTKLKNGHTLNYWYDNDYDDGLTIYLDITHPNKGSFYLTGAALHPLIYDDITGKVFKVVTEKWNNPESTLEWLHYRLDGISYIDLEDFLNKEK